MEIPLRIPNLNTLRAFDAAARQRNFRLAAEELLVTQSAVAQQVRRLEEELGVRLFERRPRGLLLSPAGRKYHSDIRNAFVLIEAATAQLRPDGRTIRLSVPPTLASRWLGARLAELEKIHPEVDLEIIATEERANFRSDGVTLAIRQGKNPASEDLVAQMMAPNHLVAVTSPGIAAEIGVIESLAMFEGLPLIQDSHRYWDAVLPPSVGVAGVRRQQFNQTGLCLDAASKGRGIAIAPSIVVADDIAEGRLRALWTWQPEDRSGFYLIHPVGLRLSLAAKSVVAWLIDGAAETGRMDF